MKAIHLMAAALGACALAACQPPAPTETPPAETAATEPATACAVTDSRNWTAHIDAMPGPNAQRTLIVAGEVDLPTPAYGVTLAAGPADRSAVPYQVINLVVTPPAPDTMAPQVITPTAVNYSGPAIAQQYAGVRIVCEGQQLAEVVVTVAQ